MSELLNFGTKLNFGTPMRAKSGLNVTMLNATVFSPETRAEMVRIQSFVKLVKPGAKNTYPPSNSNHMLSANNSAYAQNISSPTSSSVNGSLTGRKRSVLEIFRKRIKLFEKEVIGINISGEGKV